ncbi:MAG: carboxymuconolactone decarboxylase family protein [Thermoplasmatota archaeon]
MSEQPDRMDLHEFRNSRRRKTDNLLKEDHRDLKRFFALDSAAYRDATAQGGLDERTKELLGLVASTVLRCNDCIAYHCDRCVAVGWKKSELLDALNVALVVGGSITIPHLRTVWEVVEQLYEEKELKERAQEGHPGLRAAAAEVKGDVVEQDSEAKIMLGLPPEAKSRKARQAKPKADGAAKAEAGDVPAVKADAKPQRKSQGI